MGTTQTDLETRNHLHEMEEVHEVDERDECDDLEMFLVVASSIASFCLQFFHPTLDNACNREDMM